MKKLLLAATILVAGTGIALAHSVTAVPETASTTQAQNTDGMKTAFFGMHRHHRHHHRHRHFG